MYIYIYVYLYVYIPTIEVFYTRNMVAIITIDALSPGLLPMPHWKVLQCSAWEFRERVAISSPRWSSYCH